MNTSPRIDGGAFTFGPAGRGKAAFVAQVRFRLCDARPTQFFGTLVEDDAGEVADPLLAEISERKISGGRTVAMGGFARSLHAPFQCREHKLLWRPATRLLGAIYTVRLRVRDGNGAWSNVLRATAQAPP